MRRIRGVKEERVRYVFIVFLMGFAATEFWLYPVPLRAVGRGVRRLFSEGQRDKLLKMIDTYCGICILALYFSYFLVVKGMLTMFDCVKNASGVWILNADPSVQCYTVRFTLWRMATSV